MSLLSIVKAYLQSPRNWALIGAAAVTWFQGNKMGLTDDMILVIVDILAGIFGVTNSVRAPRLPEANTDDSTPA